MWVRSLGQEDILQEETVTRSTVLAWRIQGRRSLVSYSPGGHRQLDVTKETQRTHIGGGNLCLANLQDYYCEDEKMERILRN